MTSHPHFTVDGNEDHWTLLQRVSRQDRPLVVRTRADSLGLRDYALRNGVAVVRGRIRADAVAENGMPLNTISDALYTWEDELLSRLSGEGVLAFEIAAVTGEGRRDLFFATGDSASLSKCVAAAPTSGLIEAVVEDGEAAEAYFSILMPTALDKQMDGDRAVIQSLAEHGDDGMQSRQILFWFYGSVTNLEALLMPLQEHGFVLERWLEDPTGLVVALDSPATPEVFDVLAPRLLDLALTHQVEFDGWEAMVVTAPIAAEARKLPVSTKWFGPKDD